MHASIAVNEELVVLGRNVEKEILARQGQCGWDAKVIDALKGWPPTSRASSRTYRDLRRPISAVRKCSRKRGPTVIATQDSNTSPLKTHGPGSNLAYSIRLELTATGGLMNASEPRRLIWRHQSDDSRRGGRWVHYALLQRIVGNQERDVVAA